MVSSVCYLFMLLPTAGAFVRPSPSATALNIQSFSFTVADGLSAATRLNGDTAGIDGMTGMLEQLRSFVCNLDACLPYAPSLSPLLH